MSVQSDAVYSILNADATLLASLTGGIWKYARTVSGDTNSIGRNGISSVVMANAYANGLLKPCAIVAARGEMPWGGAYDHGEKMKSVRDVIEVYLYIDGDGGVSALLTAGDRVEHLLDGEFIGLDGAGNGGGWGNVITRISEDRDPDLNQALYLRIDVQVMRNKYS